MANADYGCLDESSDCPEHGHHYGKFQSCHDEAVYYEALEGADEEGGDQETVGYFQLLLGMGHTTRHPTMDCDDVHPPFPYAAYIVGHHSSGAVYVSAFDTNEEAEDDWQHNYLPVIEAWYSDEDNL